MSRAEVAQRIIPETSQDCHLETWIEAFLFDRTAANLAPRTVTFYREKLSKFLEFAGTRAITDTLQVTTQDLRLFLMGLEQTGHNPGGISAHFRAVRAFFNWFELEVEPDNWKNPVRRVKAPKVPEKPLDPAPEDTIKALVKVCERGSFTGDRDRAIILFLLDTGLRAVELTSLNLEDVDPNTGSVLVRKGKGGKSRTVFIGRKTRRELRVYLKHRNPGDCPALFVTDERERMTYQGLRFILVRRSEKAGVENPGLHAFRRAFAISMLRAGTDVFTLQALMGHSDLSVLRRYLKLVTDDLAEAHRTNGPVDRL